jgi:hypothetical protein
MIPFPIRKISPFGVDSGGQEWPDDTSAELTVSPESLPRISGPVYLELQINKFLWLLVVPLCSFIQLFRLLLMATPVLWFLCFPLLTIAE